MQTAVTRLRSRPARARSEHNERLLLEGVARGDRRAFEDLYGLYHRSLSRFVMRLAPRSEIADEVVNDTFWVIWRKADGFKGESRVSTWIMGIAYRQMLKSLRARRDGPQRHARDGWDGVVSSEEPTKAAEMQDWIARGLRELPLEQRMVLELAYYIGHSCEEIAAIVGCPLSTVKARMFHGRTKLRDALPELAGLLPTRPRTQSSDSRALTAQ